MTTLPPSIKKVIDALAEIPSIGPRQATRVGLYLASRGTDLAKELSHLLSGFEQVKNCTQCYFLHENSSPLCEICSNKNRDQKIVMIVEKETDLMSLENTKSYVGTYLILGAIPRTGILENTHRARIDSLKDRIEKSGRKLDEIILGFNPTALGDFNASLIQKELGNIAERVTRLGRGLPTGGEIEFADDETLGSALSRRN